MAQIIALQKTIEDQVQGLQKIQNEFKQSITAQNQLESQLNENKTVKEELDVLEEDAVVYKLVGPVLVKQDLSEAKETVDKRLKYIKSELERVEGTIKELEKKQESAREMLAKLQQENFQLQAKMKS